MYDGGVVAFHQVSEGIKPTLAELEKFEEQTEGMDIECILTTLLLVFGLSTLTSVTSVFSKILKNHQAS